MTERDPEMAMADALYDKMQALCVGFPAADVMYAIGLMIAHGISRNSATTNIDGTMQLLRTLVEIEVPQMARALGEQAPAGGGKE
jgi:hypothetical protein